MGPPSYMRTVVDRKVVMRRLAVLVPLQSVVWKWVHICKFQHRLLAHIQTTGCTVTVKVTFFLIKSNSRARDFPFFPQLTIVASKTWRLLGWVRNICLNCTEVGLQFQNWIRFPAWVWCNDMPVPALRGAFDLCAGVAHLSSATGRGGSLSCSETWNPLSRVQYTLLERPIFNTHVGDEITSWLCKRILVLHKPKLVARLG